MSDGFEEQNVDREEDEAQDSEMIQKVCEVIQIIADKVDAMDEELDKLTSIVRDEIIGGLKSMYDKNMRYSRIEDTRGKYGDKFKEVEDGFGKEYEGVDLYEQLAEVLEKLKEEEGFNEEEGVNGIFDSLKTRFGPVAKVEEVSVVPVEEEKSDLDSLIEKVKGMKKNKSSFM